MSLRLIIADVDGCLTPEESVPWELEEFAAFARLARAAASGENKLAPLTLCTGRPQPYCEVLMKLLDIRYPAICENGAVFYTLADNHAWLAPGVTCEKIEGLRAVRGFIERELLPRAPGAVMQFGKEAQLSVFSQQPDSIAPLKAEIEAFVASRGGPDLVINLSHFYLNISLKGADKGAAIQHLLSDLHLNRGETAGIGDTVGDLPIREAVGWFACPANARDEIKRVADYVSPHPLLAGVLDILSQLQCQWG